MTNEACHPPKREGKPAKWATYLKAISLVNESTIVKKPDTKLTSFWNVSPSPNANLAEISSFFCEPNAITENTIYFSKKLNDLVEINGQFAVKQQCAQSIEASVIEERELISYLYFRDLAIGESDDYGSGYSQQNFQCMLVEWLYDHKRLTVAQNEALQADKATIISFVKSHFNGKIWKNHLAKQANSELDRLFANFVSDGTTLTDENGQQIRLRFQDIGLKALSEWDEYKQFEIKADKLKESNDYPDIPY